MKTLYCLVFSLVAATSGGQSGAWTSRIAAGKHNENVILRWKQRVSAASRDRGARAQGPNRSLSGHDTQTFAPRSVVYNGLVLDDDGVLRVLEAGDTRTALGASRILATVYPDSIQAAIVAGRAELAAGDARGALDSVVPFVSSRAVPEVNLLACLASARLGRPLPGQMEYCEQWLRRYVSGIAPTYLESVRPSPGKAELVAWIAVGAELSTHADGPGALMYYKGALRLDPFNPLVADLMRTVEWHRSPLERARFLRPILAGALPRAAGEIRVDIANELQNCDSMIERAAKPGGG